MQILGLIPTEDEWHPEGSGLCEGDVTKLAVLTAALSSMDLLPSNSPGANAHRTPRLMIQSLELIADYDWRDAVMGCDGPGHRGCVRNVDIKGKIKDELKDAKEKARGVCLGCLKDSSKSLIANIHETLPTCENPKHQSWDKK